MGRDQKSFIYFANLQGNTWKSDDQSLLQKRVFDQNKRYFLIVIELCSDKNWSLELKNFFFSLYITWILTNIEKYWTNLILSIDYLQYNSIFRNLLKSLFVGFFAYLYFSKCSWLWKLSLIFFSHCSFFHLEVDFTVVWTISSSKLVSVCLRGC